MSWAICDVDKYTNKAVKYTNSYLNLPRSTSFQINRYAYNETDMLSMDNARASIHTHISI